MDQIIVSGLKVFAYHGVLPEEKRDGQDFYLDIVLDLPLRRACLSDKLSATVNYDEVCRVASEAMVGEVYDLIERAAEVVAQTLLGRFPAVSAVTLTLRKPTAPLCREVDYVAVRIRRERGA